MTQFLDTGSVVSGLPLKPGMRVADFGCGSGHFTIAVAERIGKEGKMSALDVQESPLDSVRARAKASGLENVETIRANLEVLGSTTLADQSQDMVLLVDTLFQSQKKREILAEARRILKTSGYVVIIDWKKNTPGFGPPNDLRTDEVDIRELAKKEGFNFEREIPTSQFHFGTLFTKN